MADIVLEKSEIEAGSSLDKQMKDTTVDNLVDKPTEPAKVEPKVEPTKVEPTKVEPTASEPAKVEPTKTVPSNDELEGTFIESIFGKKMSKDEAKKLVEILPNLAKEFEEYKSNAPTFANDYIKGLNDYLRKGGNADVYNRVQALDIDKLDGIDAIKAQYKWDHPQLTDAQIEKKLNKLYNQTEDALDEDKELGLVDIAIDAKKAKAELLKVKQENSIPEAERLRAQDEQAETKRLADWTPVTKSLVKDFNGFDIPLSFDKDGKPTDVFKFSDVSEDVKKTLEEDIRLIVEESGVPFNQESIAAFKGLVQERFIVRNFSNIVSALATEMETRATKKAIDEYRNGEPPSKGQPAPEGTKSGVDALYERQLANLIGK